MKGERSRSESRRCHRSEDRRCEWSGSGSDAGSARIGARARGGNFHESGLLGVVDPELANYAVQVLEVCHVDHFICFQARVIATVALI